MKHVLLFSLFWIFIQTIQSQTAQEEVKLYKIHAGKSYKVWLFSLDGRLKEVGGGEVYRVSSDTLSLIASNHSLSSVKNYPVQNIDQIWLRRKGKVAEGIIAGAVLGLITGVILGLDAGDDPKCDGCIFSEWRVSKETKAAIGGIILGPVGGAIGFGLTVGKIKIPIDRNKDKYLRVKDKLETIQYSPQK